MEARLLSGSSALDVGLFTEPSRKIRVDRR
jgi:hypothetical protein